MYTVKHSTEQEEEEFSVNKNQLLANHSSGCLLLSLQSSTSIQTKHSDERGQIRKENSLLLLNDDVFDVKILITL